jgi:hypothetical protein
MRTNCVSFVQFLDVRAAAVAHAGTQPADQLMDRVGQRALVRDAALDALGHELLARSPGSSGRWLPSFIAPSEPMPR